MTAVKVGTLGVWTSSFKEDIRNLVLLLELAKGRWWGKCSLALLRLGEDNSKQLTELLRSQTFMLPLMKYIATAFPGKY